jgi:integrase/recombinase XerC
MTPKTLNQLQADELLHSLLFPNHATEPTARSFRNYCIALLMLDAGLRIGEVTKLRVLDLWLKDQPVFVLTVRSEIAKRKHERTIPLSHRVRLAIINHHNLTWLQSSSPDSDYAFSAGPENHSLTARQVQRIIESASRRCLGLPIHPHVLRHTFASRLMRVTNARVVQELLGHKHLTSTQIYTHPNGDDLKNAIDHLDQIHVPQPPETTKEKP